MAGQPAIGALIERAWPHNAVGAGVKQHGIRELLACVEAETGARLSTAWHNPLGRGYAVSKGSHAVFLALGAKDQPLTQTLAVSTTQHTPLTGKTAGQLPTIK